MLTRSESRPAFGSDSAGLRQPPPRAALALLLFAGSWALLHVTPLGDHQIIDTPVYQRYGDAVLDGEVPYRDFSLEYPPGALPVFILPSLAPQAHYRSAFETLMVLCGARDGGARRVHARRDGGGPRARPAGQRPGRNRAARARLGDPHALRPLAGDADRGCAVRPRLGARAPRLRRPRPCRGRQALARADPAARRRLREQAQRRAYGGRCPGGLPCRARGGLPPVRSAQPGRAGRQLQPPDGPAAPDREPRLVAPARGAPDRRLRADRRLEHSARRISRADYPTLSPRC